MLRRTIAAVVWVFFAFATVLSFLSNQDPKWYDYASVGPLLFLLGALVLRHDGFLIGELEGWLSKLRRPETRHENGENP